MKETTMTKIQKYQQEKERIEHLRLMVDELNNDRVDKFSANVTISVSTGSYGSSSVYSWSDVQHRALVLAANTRKGMLYLAELAVAQSEERLETLRKEARDEALEVLGETNE